MRRGPKCFKMRFPTQAEADEAVAYLQERHGYKRFPRSCYSYRCPKCQGWHFTRGAEVKG